jgi:phosphoribosylformylglycinamidine synthase
MSTILPFSASSDSDVLALLKKYSIGLTVEEARKISTLLGRDPTLVEAVIWGIQGSEHCSYKSSKRFLKAFHTTGKHVILGPKEDSGIIAITDGPPGKRWGIVVSHESHNHPSQVVPFEGAATGVGGNVRDVACMGARVIGAMDALRLGDLQTEESQTIAKEVVRGIAGYGNPLGIPNLGGDVQFDSAYNDNCLVNVVCHGIVREDEIIHSYVPADGGEKGYDIIIVGKPTDFSGFGGAAFASLTLEEDEKEKNTGAVQEPNPFLERHLLASTYALFDYLAAEGKLHKVGFKDLGAGGVVCSSVEQVASQGLGADIDLGKVHTAIPDLPPEVIACAETQERFCFTCDPSLSAYILKHYNEVWDLPSIAEGARASVIGKVTKEPIYRLHFKGDIVCEARALDITSGLEYERPTKERAAGSKQQAASRNLSISERFLKMLADPNFASKSPIFRHYDKNVMGNTVIERGEGSAGVIAPLQNLQSYVHEGVHPGWDLSEEDKWRGVAVSVSGNGGYGKISAYLQGANAAVSAMRKVAAVGAVPRALTDCLNYGNPEIPEELYDFAEGVRGIAEAAKGVKIDGEPVPIISGNVSLYNSTPAGSIPPTAIVSCIGVIPDARKAVSKNIKKGDSLLFLIGDRKDELGKIPEPDYSEVQKQILFMTDAVSNGLLLSSHEIAEGGLLFTLFEMLVPAKRGKVDHGLRVRLKDLGSLSPETLLFTETGGFVFETGAKHTLVLQTLAEKHGLQLFTIGQTLSKPLLEIEGVCSWELSELLRAWDKPLEEKLGL